MGSNISTNTNNTSFEISENTSNNNTYNQTFHHQNSPCSTPIKSPKTPTRFKSVKEAVESPIRNSPLRKVLFQAKGGDQPMSPQPARKVVVDQHHQQHHHHQSTQTVEEWRWLPIDQNPTCKPSDFTMTSDCLGQGSFGKVMLATYNPTGAKIAVKIFDKKIIPSNLKNYVIAEPSTLRLLQHHNIIKLYLAHEDKENIYLYLQYIDGGDLHAHVESNRFLSEKKAFKLFYQILQAVSHCHRQGICHRDLKLENVMLTKNLQRAIVIDFGFAGIIPNANHRFTDHPGSVCYAAPELVSGKEYDGTCSDIYSLGVLLYVMVMGRYPFYSEDRRIMYHQVMHGKPNFDNNLSSEIIDLISKMLEKDPTKRIRMDGIINHTWIKSHVAEETNIDVLSPLKSGASKLKETVERASPVKPRKIFV